MYQEKKGKKQDDNGDIFCYRLVTVAVGDSDDGNDVVMTIIPYHLSLNSIWKKKNDKKIKSVGWRKNTKKKKKRKNEETKLKIN